MSATHLQSAINKTIGSIATAKIGSGQIARANKNLQLRIEKANNQAEEKKQASEYQQLVRQERLKQLRAKTSKARAESRIARTKSKDFVEKTKVENEINEQKGGQNNG